MPSGKRELIRKEFAEKYGVDIELLKKEFETTFDGQTVNLERTSPSPQILRDYKDQPIEMEWRSFKNGYSFAKGGDFIDHKYGLLCIEIAKGKVPEKKLKEKIIKSSNIFKIQWDENNLWIYFNNESVYQYKDIPESVSIAVGEAPSAGSYLHRNVKGKYHYERVN